MQEQLETLQEHDLPVREPVGTGEFTNRPTTNSTVEIAKTERAPLFAGNELGEFRHRWQDVQASFVDEPRTAVQNADELVASLMNRLTAIFTDERGRLENEWDKGENVSTENLRVALRRYRSFFDRLLSV